MTVAGGNALAQTSQQPAATKATNPPKAVRVNLNTASKAQLMKVPGINAVLAQKIIDGRSYWRKKDLITKQVVTVATYNTINHQKFIEPSDAVSSIPPPARV